MAADNASKKLKAFSEQFSQQFLFTCIYSGIDSQFKEDIVKKLLPIFLLSLTVFLSIAIAPLFAGDVAKGGKVFDANCTTCHLGGNNIVNGLKTLKKDALMANKMYSEQAIIAQVTNGKNAMPSFKTRLKSDSISDVAAYVISQADRGWK